MRRFLLVLGLCALSLLPVQPAAAGVVSTSGPVRGGIRALAFSGDALVIARQPERRAMRIELRRPGQAAKLVLLTDADDPDAGVTLAASGGAVAVGVNESPDDGPARSRVWVGPPSGPLREVAGCSRAFLVPSAAVDGPRVAWTDGGCAGVTGRPLEVGPASVAVGNVDPAVAVTRHPITRDSLSIGIALRGDSGIAGILRPTFFGVTGDVRPFGPGGLGEARESEPGGTLIPVGLLSDGTAALARAGDADSDSDSDDRGFDDDVRPRCDADMVLLAPGATARRTLQTGGCLVNDEPFDPVDTLVAGDRIVSRVSPVVEQSYGAERPRPVAISSVRPDGSNLRTIVSGSYRGPRGLGADGSRIAWWQRRCAGGEELVVADGPAPAIKACTLRVLTRRTRLRAGRISLRVSCPRGCTGRIVDDTRCGPRGLRRFTVARGTSRLRVMVPRRSRRRGRVLLRFEVDGGPARTAVVRLRR